MLFKKKEKMSYSEAQQKMYMRLLILIISYRCNVKALQTADRLDIISIKNQLFSLDEKYKTWLATYANAFDSDLQIISNIWTKLPLNKKNLFSITSLEELNKYIILKGDRN